MFNHFGGKTNFTSFLVLVGNPKVTGSILDMTNHQKSSHLIPFATHIYKLQNVQKLYSKEVYFRIKLEITKPISHYFIAINV